MEPTSRLIVKNLGKSVTDDKLRQHFAAKGEITDARVMKTAVGKSRCFGFVGFRRLEEAVQARTSLNRTFIGSSRITVEYAQARKQGGKPEPETPGVIDIKGKKSALSVSPKVGPSGDQPNPPAKESNRLKDEYMAVYAKRSATKSWANDESGPDPGRSALESKEGDSSDGGSSAESSGEEGEEEEAGTGAAFDQKLSDLDYLRSMSQRSPSTNEPTSSPQSESKRRKASNQPSEEGDNLDGARERKIAKGDKEGFAAAAAAEEGGEGGAEEAGRLYVRNIPYAVDESELRALFGQFGEVADLTLPQDEAKRQKGCAYVRYGAPEDAKKALLALDQTFFQGRPLAVVAANPRTASTRGGKEGEGGAFGGTCASTAKQLAQTGAYKQLKELERRRKAHETAGWNASHVAADAVVDRVAHELGVRKAEVLDRDAPSGMAVRLALGETKLIAENLDFFEREGVDLTALEANTSKTGALERSDCALLAKNIPASSDPTELGQLFGKHGAVARLLLPPSKTVAFVEFVDPADAKRAFKSLAYKRYRNVPLYLEWAPLRALGPKDARARGKAVAAASLGGNGLEGDLQDVDSSEARSVYVKNVDFGTSERKLRECFERAGTVRAVSIPKKALESRAAVSTNPAKDKKRPVGYCFVEFREAASVELALRDLQGTTVDGRSLQIERSAKRLAQPAAAGAAGARAARDASASAPGGETKLVVRNLAFQATSAEVRELFSTFGSLKSLRLPKKFDGHHRGFAFVEFASAHEAREAKQRLAATHLYGRRLVLDWGDQDPQHGQDSATTGSTWGAKVGAFGEKERGVAKARAQAGRDMRRNQSAASRKRGRDEEKIEEIMAENDEEDF